LVFDDASVGLRQELISALTAIDILTEDIRTRPRASSVPLLQPFPGYTARFSAAVRGQRLLVSWVERGIEG
jgi:hypothetical protein